MIASYETKPKGQIIYFEQVSGMYVNIFQIWCSVLYEIKAMVLR